MALARRCRRLLRGLIPPMTRRRQVITGALLMALGVVLAVVVPSPYVDLARVVLTELDELDLPLMGACSSWRPRRRRDPRARAGC